MADERSDARSSKNGDDDSDDDSWTDRSRKKHQSKIRNQSGTAYRLPASHRLPDTLEDAVSECKELRAVERSGLNELSRDAAAIHRNRIHVCIYFMDNLVIKEGREAELRDLLRSAGARHTAKGDLIAIVARWIIPKKRRRRADAEVCALQNARLQNIAPDDLLDYLERSGGIDANERAFRDEDIRRRRKELAKEAKNILAKLPTISRFECTVPSTLPFLCVAYSKHGEVRVKKIISDMPDILEQVNRQIVRSEERTRKG